MFKSWQLLVVIGFIIVLVYVGFDFYNSFSGQDSDFKKEITPVDPDLRIEVLDHTAKAAEELPYNLDMQNEDLQNLNQEIESLNP